jgi:hypothetical protein
VVGQASDQHRERMQAGGDAGMRTWGAPAQRAEQGVPAAPWRYQP